MIEPSRALRLEREPPAEPAPFAAPRALASPDRLDVLPGVIAALLVLAIYGGVALSVNFPRAAFGFQSDEATYYMMGHSLAEDADLTYRRDDLVRVWREFAAGPSGVFLKRGQDVRGLELTASVPFIALDAAADPDPTRLYYGKAFAYPLFAAPLVALLGTNGFLLLNAVCLAVLMLASYLFLAARSRPVVAVLLGAGFLFGSVAPSYFVWITPELFNLTLVALGYFCWLFKEVTTRPRTPASLRWLHTPWSDIVAAVLLGIATFSKPSNVLLIGPPLVWMAWHRHWMRAVVCGVVFGAVVAGLFAVNIAIMGDWNYQGGERRTYYAGYPFQTADAGFDVGMDRATNRVLTEVIFDPTVFWTVLRHNLGYFFIGRYSGLAAYFFPGVFALGAFLLSRRRAAWQYLVLLVALAEILLLIIWIPYNYFGGGGVLGNRYFMNTYGLFLFLLPPIQSLVAAVIPWIVGGIFTAQITLNPFYASFHPAEHAKTGPLRLLPVELTLVNDLPINTNINRVRVPFGAEGRRFQIYFLDDNAFDREEAGFWVRGEATAELLLKAADPVSRVVLTLQSGDRENVVTVEAGGESRTVAMGPGEIHQVSLPLGEGFPYQGTRVWVASIASRTGFVPMFTSGGRDSRYLGVRVTPELVP